MPTPLGPTSDCVRFAKSASRSAGHVAAPSAGRHPLTGQRLGSRGWRDSSPSHALGRDAERPAGDLDELVRSESGDGRLALDAKRHAHAASSPRSAPSSASTEAPAAKREVGSPPSSANHLEVSLVRNHTIAPVRQLRLVLTGSASAEAPEEIWDSLPEEVRREVLVRLAALVSRWFQSQRTQP